MAHFTVSMKFYQLWTIFISVGRHSLAAIHCLLTGKNQYLYQAILESVRHNIPHFRPQASMSDWEEGPRNAFRVTYPQLKLYECWFHVTQRIWVKTQELSLVVKNKKLENIYQNIDVHSIYAASLNYSHF